MALVWPRRFWQVPSVFERPGPHVFALPIGTDFATQLVQGIKERFAGQPPDLLARTRLFVNSQRMLRRVTDAFVAAEAGFLPQMLVVTELDKWADLADFPAEISPLRRQLELAKLIDALLRTQPDLAPRSALFDLAESLATLLGEMQEEGVSTLDIARLDVANHSAHWARSLAFLQIIAPIFDDPADVQARQRLSALRLAEVWRKQAPDGPVIVAGSTGSRGATFVLMQAVARLDQGAIVLPGFDFDLPAKVWAAMDDGDRKSVV